MTNNFELDLLVFNNFKKVSWWLLLPPFIILFSIYIFFALSEGTSFVDSYVGVQKDLFFFLNSTLSEYPNVQFNLTQLGDALILYPLIIIFLFYAPKLWQAVLASSLITLIISAVLKRIFAVPRPAAIFDNDSFTIVGRTLTGHTSLPSGHSITIFMVMTILLYAFMPKKTLSKIFWFLFIFILGIILVLSRVGVGAHYPLDIVIGSAIGFIAAIIGIVINKNAAWLNWIKNKRFYPIFMVILGVWAYLIINKIIANNLPVFYLSLLALVVTLFIIIKAYVQKN